MRLPLRGRGKPCPYRGDPPSKNDQVVCDQDEREGVMGIEAGGGDQGVEEGRRGARAAEEAPEEVGGSNGHEAQQAVHPRFLGVVAVSYTHLTLPTIYSV